MRVWNEEMEAFVSELSPAQFNELKESYVAAMNDPDVIQQLDEPGEDADTKHVFNERMEAARNYPHCGRLVVHCMVAAMVDPECAFSRHVREQLEAAAEDPECERRADKWAADAAVVY